MQKAVAVSREQVFSLLADRHSSNILKTAFSGMRASSTNYIGNLSKKQFYVRLKRLCDAGLIEKRGSFYRTTTFGSLVFNSQVKTMEETISSYWQLKSIDVLRARTDFPSEEKETIVNEILGNTELKNILNSTHLTGFNIIKNYDALIVEVLKLLEKADREVYFATRYHQPHVSNKVFEKFGNGVILHVLDGNPEQISVENRLNAIIRTPPNKESSDLVERLLRSNRFDLMRLPDLPISFIVVDGTHVMYETVNYTNPEQFTTAISKLNDQYLAQQFIQYFKYLSKTATLPKLLEQVRAS
jgi:predicted transcriptional regulator